MSQAIVKSKSTENESPCDRSVQWTDHEIRYLMRLYRLQPSLWNKNNLSYLNRYARRLAYETIYDGVNCALGLFNNVVEVIVKIREIRKFYIDELRKMTEASLNGCTYKSPHVWFDELNEFLYVNLHLDEIETIESCMKEQYFSSNYCDDDNLSCSYERETLNDTLSETISPKKPNCCTSSPCLTSAKHYNDPIKCTCKEQLLRTRSTVNDKERKNFEPNSSYIYSKKFSDNVNACSRIPSQNKEKNMAFNSSKNHSILPIKTNEESMTYNQSQCYLTARKSSSEQFDLFAKCVACQLKQMNPDISAKAKTEIQRILKNHVYDDADDDNAVSSTAEYLSNEDLGKFSDTSTYTANKGTSSNYSIVPILEYYRII